MWRIPFFPIRSKTPLILYEFRLGNKPVLATDVAGQHGKLIDCYLQLDDLCCCNILGGFKIFADGKPAMQITDEVSMSQNWLPGIISLQQGEPLANIWAWEESHMTLTKVGEYVDMEDVHHSGVVGRKTRFVFTEFVAAMLEASRPVAVLVDSIRATVQERLSNAKEEQEKQKLQVLLEEFSADWTPQIAEIELLSKKARGES
jgi:hypothetical protein